MSTTAFDFSHIDMAMIPGDTFQAILEEGISPYAFLLLAMIDHLSHENGRGCVASNEELGNGIGLGDRHTRNIIEQLIERGILVTSTKRCKDHTHIRYLNTYWTEGWRRIPDQIEENICKNKVMEAGKVKR